MADDLTALIAELRGEYKRTGSVFLGDSRLKMVLDAASECERFREGCAVELNLGGQISELRKERNAAEDNLSSERDARKKAEEELAAYKAMTATEHVVALTDNNNYLHGQRDELMREIAALKARSVTLPRITGMVKENPQSKVVVNDLVSLSEVITALKAAGITVNQ